MWKPRLYYLIGCWVLVIGGLQLIPLLYAIVLGEKTSFHSLFSSIVSTGLIGGSLVLGFRGVRKIRTRKLTILLPVFGITAMAFASGLPFFFMLPDQGIFAAFYDGMSLITTNGTSAYEGTVDSFRALQLWRAIAAWSGGYLAICLTLSLLSAMNVGGLQLHMSPMPFGDSEVGYARLKATAQALYPVYIVVTAACAVLLWVSGAGNFINSCMMAMATISTAGLVSIYGDAVNNIGPQLVIAVFLLFSMANWDIHYMRFKKRSIRFGHDIEYRTLLFMIAAATVLITLVDGSFDATFIWQAMFSAIAAISTSGISPDGLLYSTESALPFAIVLMALAAIGGASISSTGGLRQLRAIIIYKTGRAEVERLAHPHSVAGLHYGGNKVGKKDVEAVWLLLGSFVLIMALGALALAILGLHFQDALSMSFTALTLSGPLISIADPYFGGYAGLRDVDYSVLSLLMLVGRIEASIFMALFVRVLWRA